MRRRQNPLALTILAVQHPMLLTTAEQQARYALTLQRIQRATAPAAEVLHQLGIEVPHA